MRSGLHPLNGPPDAVRTRATHFAHRTRGDALEDRTVLTVDRYYLRAAGVARREHELAAHHQ